ncbi:MAG: penicillin-binding protein activator [Desulfobacteraceae bacterium]
METGEKRKHDEKVQIMERDLLEEKEEPSLYDVLVREAGKLIRAGETREALVFYNKAMELASKPGQKTLMKKIKPALALADTRTLKELGEKEDLFIPRPLVLYRLALNLTLDENYKEALKVVDTFREEYPEHHLSQDAAEIKWLIEKSRFKRELVGCMLPLTGKYSFFGKRAMSGIEVAVKDFRKANPDRNIRVVIKDTGSKEEQALSCVKEFCDMGVAALVGPMGTAEAAGRVAEKNGIPMMAMTQKDLSGSGENFLFSNFLTPRLQAKGLASYAFYRLGIRDFAIIYPQDDYGERYMNLFWDMIADYGGNIKGVESYGPDQTDFAESLRKISGRFYGVPDFIKENSSEYEEILVIKDKDKEGEDKPKGKSRRDSKEEKVKFGLDFKAVFIPDSSERVGMMLPQLAFHDIEDVVLLGTNLWHNKSLIEDAAGYTDNAVITSGFYPESSKNPEAMRFAEEYENLYGASPGFVEAVAYDSALIVFKSLLDDTVKSRDDLRDAIAGGMVHNGATGRTYFDDNGDLHKELFYLTIEGDDFTEITRSFPRQ